MSRKIRLNILLTTLLFCHMITFGTMTALTQVPSVPALFERMTIQTPPTQLPPGDSWPSNKVTKDDITWTFNKNYTVGQFISGDWYVVAPSGLQVTGISTSGSEPLGGSMRNPAPDKVQGYVTPTTYGMVYDASLNVGKNLPISLAAGDKLVTVTKYQYYGVTSPSKEKNYTGVEQAAILTILSSVPPSGSFRPGLCDPDNVIYNESIIDYSLLSKLSPAPGGPSLAKITDMVARPWLDHYRGWSGRAIHPNHNMRDYGGELAGDIGTIALMANCNFTNAEKRPLIIGLIQMGLDFYSNVKRVQYFYQPTPVHMLGRKFPIMFAGNMLNIAEIKAIWPKTGSYLHEKWGVYPGNAKKFSEDVLIEYVRQEDVKATVGGVAQYQGPDNNYTVAMIGMPEWFHHDYAFRWKGNPTWGVDSYRIIYQTIAGEVLATHIMGWSDQWNNQAIFDYLDRYAAIAQGRPDPFGYTVPGEVSGNRGWGGSGWNDTMWDKYRGDY